MKKYSLIAALLLIALFAVQVHAEDNDKYTVIEVESSGENRLAAIEAGLVEALKQASGSYIDSKTELNNEELTERIISYSRGSIARYDVLSEDSSRADEGIYSVKLRVMVESDLLRDGVKIATNKTARVTFSKKDLEPERPVVSPTEATNTDKIAETNKTNAQSGVEALSAMLDRYNPEDFINIKVVGKVTPVKGKEAEDLVQVLVEVSFNDALYNEKFIPDLKQVLDNIAAKKKDIVLTKQRDILRTIANGKPAPMADNSVILSGSNLGKDFQLAVYDKPDRLGCRVYAFSKDDADKILNNQTGVLAKFRGRIARLKGFEVELLDENDSLITTNEQKATLPFLLTDSVIRNNVWAFHPTIMKYAGLYDFVPLYNECRTVTLPLRFELIEEIQEITRAINVKLLFEDSFEDSAIKTRNALHTVSLNFGKNTAYLATSTTGFNMALDIIETRQPGGRKLVVEYLSTIDNQEAMEIMEEFQQLARGEVSSKRFLNSGMLEELLRQATYAQQNKQQISLDKDFNELESLAKNDEYPLAQAAFDTIRAAQITSSQKLSINEAVERLAEFREKGNHAAIFYTFAAFENDIEHFDNQKKCVQYLTQAAMADPDAMIRMGEVLEQGFYDVKPNQKRADFYYKEGIRILSLLASQGLPSAALSLGHVYIEGLGTNQDIPRAERYYKFAEKSGYTDKEFWLWKRFGVALRQVTIPNNLKKTIASNSKGEPRTCLYLVREGSYCNRITDISPDSNNYEYNRVNHSTINVSVSDIAHEIANKLQPRNFRLDISTNEGDKTFNLNY